MLFYSARHSFVITRSTPSRERIHTSSSTLNKHKTHAATINQLTSAETTPGTAATATPKRMAKEVENFIVAWSWRWVVGVVRRRYLFLLAEYTSNTTLQRRCEKHALHESEHIVKCDWSTRVRIKLAGRTRSFDLHNENEIVQYCKRKKQKVCQWTKFGKTFTQLESYQARKAWPAR